MEKHNSNGRITENKNEQSLSMDGLPAALRIPLDEISFGTSGGELEEDAIEHLSDISIEEEMEEEVVSSKSNQQRLQESQPKENSVPRSIFTRYWKADPKPALKASSHADLNPSARKDNGQMRTLKCVQDQQRFQFCCMQDVRAYADSDSVSISTYERTLQEYEQSVHAPPASRSSFEPNSMYESRPLWMALFTNKNANGYYSSEPHLPASSLGRRAVQSDTALIRKPKSSCLRRGRFSIPNAATKLASPSSPAHGNSTASKNPNPPPNSKVCFQSKIEVHVYQSPVEKFATSGWSDWFR